MCITERIFIFFSSQPHWMGSRISAGQSKRETGLVEGKKAELCLH